MSVYLHGFVCFLCCAYFLPAYTMPIDSSFQGRVLQGLSGLLILAGGEL